MYIMPIFQYLTFLCDQFELQSLLTRYGLERWRLHTCDPVVGVGIHGSGIIQVLVVMDRVVDVGLDPSCEPDGGQLEGIAMRG